MRPTIILTLAALSTLPVLLVAQASKTTKIHRNEIGMDLTYLLSQFFHVDRNMNYQPYLPTYAVTYKRMTENFNFRTGLGGYSQTREWPDDAFPDKIDNTKIINIDFRIGFEKNAEISKRWSFHYGLDFRYNLYYSHSDERYSLGDWAVGDETYDQKLAIAPIVMVEFKINQRLSLQTEASYGVYYRRYEYKPLLTQISETLPSPIPAVAMDEYEEFGDDFYIPNFLILAVKI